MQTKDLTERLLELEREIETKKLEIEAKKAELELLELKQKEFKEVIGNDAF